MRIAIASGFITVSPAGGEPTLLPLGPAASIAYSPTGAVVLGRWTDTDPARWKRYRGGRVGNLWIDRSGTGEFDRLVLESQGFSAVTSTAGALTFRRDWAEALRSIQATLYICFDRDTAGHVGAARVGRLLPEARIVSLPTVIGKSNRRGPALPGLK